ncbi:MAG: alpha/beta hydrolase [Clostridia bacterium]|nr:alpha/beta hydrolase [Clostridia bacterium]
MDIKCTQNMFRSTSGCSDITYYILRPEGVELRGIVQISHGVCDYFSRYTRFAKYLCGLGFIVCGNDHLGHGCSAAKSTDLGFFGPRDGWRYLVDDMEALHALMQTRYPELPYFTLGYSMGSFIARLHAAQHGTQLCGMIILGTAGPNPLSRTAIRLANSVAHSRGTTYRSAFLSRLAYNNFNRKIKDSTTPFDWISRDKQVVELFLSDEKCNFMLTAAGYRDLFSLLLHANTPKCYKSTPRALPLLLLSGDMDPVGAYGDGVRQVANLYRGAGMRDLDVIFYKGGRHDLLNEVNSPEVFGDISRWLERQLREHKEDAPPCF